MNATIPKGIVVTYTAKGIPTKISKRFIIKISKKQIKVINCASVII